MPPSNALRATGKPLFFAVETAAGERLGAPATRLGEALRTHVRSLSAMQKEAIVVSTGTDAVWRLASDEGAYLNGLDEAPCPLSFLTTGMVCNYMNEVRALASKRHIEIRHIRLVQDNFYTMKGSALRGTMIGGARNVELAAHIDSDATADELTKLVEDAVTASAINGLVAGRHDSLFSLTHNSRQINCERVLPVETSVPDILTDDAYDSAQPRAGDWSSLIVRNGPSPDTSEANSFAGSSLTEQQDRILHVRGICTVREDGVKAVEQQLFNPHGSIFHFLCDESPQNGGRGLAPDAATYISAGIGFCFMTQLGRFATIAKKNLRDYRICQDTHFSPGGASGTAGKKGSAEPVETHLQLHSDEPDEFARTALDMSEQTCFLHALCRTALTTEIQILPFEETVD